MTNFNNDVCELNMDELELASGGNGVSLTLFGRFIHIGVDQTGAPCISIHSADGKSGTTYRGEPA